MRKLSPLLLIIVLCTAAFAQSYKTEAFKANLRALAGTDNVDTTEFDKVSKINTGFGRKAYARSLTPAKELALWRVHYAYALSTYTYTPEQEAFVKEASKLLNLEFFKAKRLPVEEYKQTQAFRDATDLSERAKDLFIGNPQLYRDTFEIPGYTGVEIVSKCSLKQRAQLGALVAYHGRMVDAKALLTTFLVDADCDCNWAAGCDSWKCGCGKCTEVINCGIFGGSVCSSLCGAKYCTEEPPQA